MGSKQIAIKMAGEGYGSLPADFVTQHIDLDSAGYTLVDEETFAAMMAQQDDKLAAFRRAQAESARTRAETAAAVPVVIDTAADVDALRARLVADLAAVDDMKARLAQQPQPATAEASAAPADVTPKQ